MIASFRHRGLQSFFLTGSKAGICPEHATRLRLVLGQLSVAKNPRDMALPGLRLHKLKGEQDNRWSLSVSGNWRITFSFHGKNAVAVDYEDYH
ncbi:MAG: peptidase [Gammaproteobacteria bacterium]|jgi:proteic killer suppression protein|nr:peptidase [Gammaproteobacteria bacterium]